MSRTSSGTGFTVGICATGLVKGLTRLLTHVLSEPHPQGTPLRKLVIVASECPPSVISELRRVEAADNRVHAIVEEKRYGKAQAINRILAQSDGDFLVLVNSDAYPERGAIAQLIARAESDPEVGAVSAMPITSSRSGPTSLLTSFMWSIHNDCSTVLNHLNLSNHSSDELVLFRPSAISELPDGLVNDGAFMAATARKNGFSVKFSTSARVHIEVPRRISDLISQRRRILFGHAQVWRWTGEAPRTIESLMITSPLLALRLVVRTISNNPRFILALPMALVSEVSAALLSLCDVSRSSKEHAVWKRYE